MSGQHHFCAVLFIVASLFFQPNMDKYKVVTYKPADKGSWVDSSFIHNQHGTFTNQVMNEFA